MLACLLAEGLQSQELLLDLLIETIGVEQSTSLTEIRSLLQKPACRGREFIEILLDQVDDEATHHLLILDHRVEYPDRSVKIARIDVLTCLGSLGKMLIAEFETQVAQFPGAPNHLEELCWFDAELLFVEQAAFSIKEKECRLIVSEIVRREDLTVLDCLDLLLVARPTTQFLDHATSAEKSTLEVRTAAILGHGRGVEKDQHGLHRSALPVERVAESLTLHPWQEITFAGDIGCCSGMPSAAATGTSGTPGYPGDGRTNSSALSPKSRTRE